MPPSELARHAGEALLLTVALSLPIVGVAALVGMIVAALQAATQVQDPTLAHLPRMLAVVVAIIVAAPWIGGQVHAFAVRMFLAASGG